MKYLANAVLFLLSYRLRESKIGRLQIFYNSHFSFHQRLYVDLEAILLHIRLCKPLSNIVNQPLLYIRDMVPLPCFEALIRLDCSWISDLLFCTYLELDVYIFVGCGGTSTRSFGENFHSTFDYLVLCRGCV